MAYLKYKELSKYFYFSKVVDNKNLPAYIFDYVYDGESVLVGYKTLRDHGVFTDKKIILFDNKIIGSRMREIFTIPYNNISSISVVFKSSAADLVLNLDNGYPLRLKFVKMEGLDKLRLRILYNTISRVITGQKISSEDMEKLSKNNFNFESEVR